MVEKIFADSEEKFLTGVVLSPNSDDILCYDGETDKVSKEDLINLFYKGVLIIDDGESIARPMVLTPGIDYATVVVGETSYYSDGYSQK